MRLIFFVLILFFSCSSKRVTNEIKIVVNVENQYFVNDKLVNEDGLKKTLLDEKKKIISSGFTEEEINVLLKIDRRVKVKYIAALQTVLRQLNFRKITYADDQSLGDA